MDQLTPAAAMATPDDGACAQAYEDYFHKIKADIGYDRWRAIWGFMRRRQAEVVAPAMQELGRLATLGQAVETSAGPLKEGHELLFLQIASAALSDYVMANLERLAEAISSGATVAVIVGEEGERMRSVAELVGAKFANADGVPVESITLTRAEAGLLPLEGLQ